MQGHFVCDDKLGRSYEWSAYMRELYLCRAAGIKKDVQRTEEVKSPVECICGTCACTEVCVSEELLLMLMSSHSLYSDVIHL